MISLKVVVPGVPTQCATKLGAPIGMSFDEHSSSTGLSALRALSDSVFAAAVGFLGRPVHGELMIKRRIGV
jgi:hypothetical protein